jgi:hypothetical protein
MAALAREAPAAVLRRVSGAFAAPLAGMLGWGFAETVR